MDPVPVASGSGPAIAGDRSGAGSLVIVVGGAAQRRAAGAARAQLAGPIMVVVLGAWPVRVLRPGGPLPTRLVVDEPGLAVDDRRPPLPEGHPAGRAGPGRPVAATRPRTSNPRRWGFPLRLPRPRPPGSCFAGRGEYWTVVFDRVVVRLRDAKGMGHLARLLADPGREFHVVELEAANRQAGPAALGPPGRAGASELAVRPDLGDAGALLDTAGKAAYQARLTELEAELEEAQSGNDPARAARARQERDFLVAELARAVGLGGRDRRAASHAERARLNVTRAIRAALANLARANPSLWPASGRHNPDGPVLLLHPRPAGPDDPAALTRLGPSPIRPERPWTRVARHPRPGGKTQRYGGVVHGREGPLEAAAVLIGIQVECTQPLAGTAAAKQSPAAAPRWLAGAAQGGSELVAAAPRPGRRTRRRSPGIEARRGMPAGWIPNRRHEQPSAEHLGLGLGGCSPPGRWHPRAEHHRPGRRRAHRCRARPLHGDRGGRGVHHPKGCVGPAPLPSLAPRRPITQLDWIAIVASPAMISTWCEGERITSPNKNR